MERILKCPFCGGSVHIVVCDEEGNFKDEEYEKDPWSGLSYALLHEEKDVPTGKRCPIATFDDDRMTLGTMLYDSPEEAADAWEQ